MHGLDMSTSSRRKWGSQLFRKEAVAEEGQKDAEAEAHKRDCFEAVDVPAKPVELDNEDNMTKDIDRWKDLEVPFKLKKYSLKRRKD